MKCAQMCLLCEKPKKHFVNFTKFHAFCENHKGNSQLFLQCKHCSTNVPILNKFESTSEPDSFVEFPNKELSIVNYSAAIKPCQEILSHMPSISKELLNISLSRIPNKKTQDLKNLEIKKKDLPKLNKQKNHPEVSKKFSVYSDRQSVNILVSDLNLDDDLHSDINTKKLKDNDEVSPKSQTNGTLINNRTKCKICNLISSNRYCLLVLIIVVLFGIGVLIVYLV